MSDASEVLERYGEYRVETTSRAFACMDDRPVAQDYFTDGLPSVLYQGDRILYNQVAGGGAGVAFDHATLHETVAPGLVTGTPSSSLTNQAVFLSKVFSRNRFYLFNHFQCAAQLKAKEVAATMRRNIDELADFLEERTPDIPRYRYEEAAEAAGNLAVSPLFNMEPEEALVNMSGASDSKISRPIPALRLINSSHKGEDLIIDRGKGFVFDTARAFKNGSPAYYASIGNFVRLLQENGIIMEGVDIEAPTILRHVAIARYHLESRAGNPLGVHFIDPPAKNQ